MMDAWKFASRSGLASVGFFVHGVFPFAFEHTGSGLVGELHSDIQEKLNKVRVESTL